MESAPDLLSELDIYWTAYAQIDVVSIMKKWGKRIPLLHVKDGNLESRIHLPIGEGKVAIKEIIESADDETLEWLIVELDACETDMTEAVAKSVDWLAQMQLGIKA